jgi:choline dehydrogenase
MASGEYDYIIIGAGSAGSVLAARLSEDPGVRVLVLEAGGRNTSVLVRMPAGVGTLIKQKSKFNWGFWSEPEPFMDGRRLWHPRGKGLGGSSAINGMVYIRGHARDYDHWRQRGWTAGPMPKRCPTSNAPKTSRTALRPTTAKAGRFRSAGANGPTIRSMPA